MNFTTQYLASPLAPSSQYLAFLKGYPQSASDGGSVIKDYSAALNQAAIDPYLSYANAMSEVGWITCLSVAHPAGFSVSHAAISTWDMSSGKSLILAFQFKTSAIPSVRTNFVGTSGGGQNGIGLDIDTNGRLGCLITDGTHSYNSGHGSGPSLCDGNPHTVVIFIDGSGKKIYIMVDGVPNNAQYGTSIASVTGSTVSTSASLGFGNPSSGTTWDVGSAPTSPSVKFRNIHVLVMSSFPSNFADILTWMFYQQNIFSQIPSTLLS